MIDSHCHLDHESLSTNLEEVISRSKAIGIDKLLSICTTSNGYENILKIVEIDPIIYGTFGIHPHETDNDKVNKNEIVKKIKLNKKIIGVGETGLDFYYNNSDKEAQLWSFKKHIEASIELNISCFEVTSRCILGALPNNNCSGKSLRLLSKWPAQ